MIFLLQVNQIFAFGGLMCKMLTTKGTKFCTLFELFGWSGFVDFDLARGKTRIF